MKEITKVNEYKDKISYKLLIEDHTISTHEFYIYKDENYINNLLKQIRKTCRDKDIKIRYNNKSEDRKLLNSKITDSNNFYNEFMSVVDRFKFKKVIIYLLFLLYKYIQAIH